MTTVLAVSETGVTGGPAGTLRADIMALVLILAMPVVVTGVVSAAVGTIVVTVMGCA